MRPARALFWACPLYVALLAVLVVADPGPMPWLAAGLLAGLRAFYREPDLVLVLAVDMPRVGPGTFARLLEAALAPGRADRQDGALLVGAGGRRQPLCAVYRSAALRRVRPVSLEDEHGLPVHRLVGALDLVEVAEVADESHDVDTWSDLRELRERTERT